MSKYDRGFVVWLVIWLICLLSTPIMYQEGNYVMAISGYLNACLALMMMAVNLLLSAIDPKYLTKEEKEPKTNDVTQGSSRD